MVNREDVMKCYEVQEHLSAWLDGEVPEDLRPRLVEHLAACPACQAELAALERLDAALAELEAPAPRDLAAGVLRRLSRPTPSWVRSLALAACLVLGIFLGGSLTGTLYPGIYAPAHGNGEVASLEIFQDYPQGSVGSAFSYQGDEENNG
jgi:anti-sigma factor (TIGR02949 family)